MVSKYLTRYISCYDDQTFAFVCFPDKPGAPEAPEVTEVFKNSCVVSWQPPESDGGSPVIGYHVERRLTSSKRWIKINKEIIEELTYNTTDLFEGNEYEFCICAENKVGVGPPSSPSPPSVAIDPWGKQQMKSYIVHVYSHDSHIGRSMFKGQNQREVCLM